MRVPGNHLLMKLRHFAKRNERNLKRAGVALAVLLVVFAGWWTSAPHDSVLVKSSQGEWASTAGSSSQASVEQDDAGKAEGDTAKKLCVYLCGQVNSPGVYYVDPGARVCDAIELAQGFSEDAAVESLNLARELHDGEQITVPSVNAMPSADDAQPQSDASSLVNINTASSSQLQQIPGIGAAYAQRIIDYRSAHGSFKSVDELKNVSGIGSKKIESIRAYVCV